MNWKERTKQLLAERDMSQTDLANQLGVTRATISLWLGENANYTNQNVAKIQYKIAAALDVSKEYLATGYNRNKPKGRGVPVLDQKDIPAWLNNRILPEDASLMFCPVACSESTYAMEVHSRAMDSQGRSGASFPAGSMVYVDPAVPQKEGAVCVLEDKDIMVGIYERLNGQDTVVFLNPDSPRMQVDNLRYHGSVIGSFMMVKQY